MRSPPDSRERRPHGSQPALAKTLPGVEPNSSDPERDQCICNDIARRLDLLVEYLGVDLDVLAAKEEFDRLNGDVDVDTWLMSCRDPATGKLPAT